MSVKKGDYFIAEEGKKFKLYKALHPTADSIKAVVEASKLDGKREITQVDPLTVVLNLGRKPKYGRVYGQLIEPLRKCRQYKQWGDIHFYRRLDKFERKSLKLGLDAAYKRLVKHRLEFIFPITIEIRHKAGRWDGFYKKDPKYDNTHNHMTCFKPQEFTAEGVEELAIHEMGHAVWFQGVPDAVKLQWIELYTYYLTLHTAKMDVIKELRKGLEKARDLSEYRAELRDEEEEDQQFSHSDILDECIGYIRSTFNLDGQEVDILVERSDSLEPYWPKNPFDLSDAKAEASIAMTDYGMTKCVEFFAEAFRLYVYGKSGKKITKLMGKTLARLQK